MGNTLQQGTRKGTVTEAKAYSMLHSGATNTRKSMMYSLSTRSTLSVRHKKAKFIHSQRKERRRRKNPAQYIYIPWPEKKANSNFMHKQLLPPLLMPPLHPLLATNLPTARHV
jgi:hypothetical protein